MAAYHYNPRAEIALLGAKVSNNGGDQNGELSRERGDQMDVLERREGRDEMLYEERSEECMCMGGICSAYSSTANGEGTSVYFPDLAHVKDLYVKAREKKVRASS